MLQSAPSVRRMIHGILCFRTPNSCGSRQLLQDGLITPYRAEEKLGWEHNLHLTVPDAISGRETVWLGRGRDRGAADGAGSGPIC